MLKSILIFGVIALATVAADLDLNATCAGTQQYHCIISNLDDFESLQVANVSADTLQSLIIHNSSLRMLPQDLFTYAPKLKKLIVHRSRLHHLTSSDFQQSNHLTYLNLQFNMLAHIPQHSFRNVIMLQQLLLGYNNIMYIEENAFQQMSLLKYLDLEGNELRDLPANIFDDMLNLEYLDLSKNKLQRIDGHTFAMNMRLRTLLLSHNQFSLFAANALEHLPKLHLLDLSNCRLDELYLNSVGTLLVSYSGLKRLIVADAIQHVHANHNELQTVEVGDANAVIELNLRSNNVSTLIDIARMDNLQHLDLMHNSLKTLSVGNESIELSLPALNYLNLAGNQFKNLSMENFLVMQQLSQLDLSMNNLTQLDVRIFDGLINLEKLYIEHNMLQELDYAQLHRQHKTLTVLAPFGNRWDWSYLHKMLIYLKDHGVEVIRHSKINYTQDEQNTRNASTKTIGDQHDLLLTALNEHNNELHVKSVHTEWTTRDIFTVTALIVVFLLLIMQMLRILQDEGCLHRWCARLAGSRPNNNRTQSNTTTQNPHRLLNEEDSEV